MSEYLSTAAAALGIPEDLVQRSADARATADGVSVDDILAAWAGGAPAPTGSAPAVAEPAPVAAQESVEEAAPVADAPAAAAAPVATAAPQGFVSAPAAPATVTGSEALDYDAVITVPTAGISERTKPDTPRWLALLFLVVPLLGLTYLITFAQGPECGSGGQLGVDRLTGAVENCDGTIFVAAGGGGGVDVRSIVIEGGALYTAPPGNCTSCHGAAGQGGTGPALNGGAVLSTFAACTDHLEWVGLGTTGFQSAGRATYGDLGTAVGSGGVMPAFEAALTPDQLAAIVLFERVQFGGQDPAEAATDCGFVDPAADETTDQTVAALDQ